MCVQRKMPRPFYNPNVQNAPRWNSIATIITRYVLGMWNFLIFAWAYPPDPPTRFLSSEKLASPNCTSVYQPPKPNTQSHICLYLLRASYHPFLPPETRQIAPPGGGGGGQSAADQLEACECSECAQYLLRCSNQTITETETLVTDIELYDKRKHPKERKLFTSETPEVRTVFQILKKFSKKEDLRLFYYCPL